MITSRSINNCTSNSGLIIFNNKKTPKNLEQIPSDEDFSKAVNTIFDKNPLSLPHSEEEIQNLVDDWDFGQANDLKKENDAVRLNHTTTCMKQLLSDPTITRRLASRAVTVNEWGIPLYTEAERKIYDLDTMPYISFRNPNLKRCPQQPILFGKNYSIPYDDLTCALFGKQKDDAWCAPDYNTFYLLSTYTDELKPILEKNKNKLEKNKNCPKSTELKGIHYLNKVYDFSKVLDLIDSIRSTQFTLDETDRNTIIFVFDDWMGHFVCGILTVNSEDINNPIVTELSLFDSESSDNDYPHDLENTFKKHLKNRPPIKFTYICYNIQIDGPEPYEKDYNCAFYSVRAANQLVEILRGPQDSPLRKRILESKKPGETDSEEDIAIYAQEIAAHLPELFDYDPESKSYKAKSFKKREICNIAARWDTGKRVFKKYARDYAKEHQLPEPSFKLKQAEEL
ncbi:hypothetical protein AYO37_00265 [Opitutia bacterium SCGC AG-212-L18]|nr:hypothetical protein AYO37_00265 [Opitutae bacterium SCGC AG-212-L18]